MKMSFYAHMWKYYFWYYFCTLNLLVHMIKISLDLLWSLWPSLVIFGKLWKFFENVWKCLSRTWTNFGKILKNLQKVVSIFRKSPQTLLRIARPVAAVLQHHQVLQHHCLLMSSITFFGVIIFLDDAIEQGKLGIKIQYSSSRPQLNPYIYLFQYATEGQLLHLLAQLCWHAWDNCNLICPTWISSWQLIYTKSELMRQHSTLPVTCNRLVKTVIGTPSESCQNDGKLCRLLIHYHLTHQCMKATIYKQMSSQANLILALTMAIPRIDSTTNMIFEKPKRTCCTSWPLGDLWVGLICSASNLDITDL